jgi:hypothetical protein
MMRRRSEPSVADTRGTATRLPRRARAVVTLAILAAAGAASAGAAAAQIVVPPLEPVGHRGRVHFCDARPAVHGTITTLDSTGISLRELDATLTVPLRDIRQLEIRWKNRGRWATIGLFTGMAAAATATFISADRANDYYSGLIGLFIVTPIAGLIGAPVGAILAPEEWERVPFDDIGAADRPICPPSLPRPDPYERYGRTPATNETTRSISSMEL